MENFNFSCLQQTGFRGLVIYYTATHFFGIYSTFSTMMIIITIIIIFFLTIFIIILIMSNLQMPPPVPQPLKVPEGFVLVKINKQLYLVPKEQLPALFTQTNSLRVQVIQQLPTLFANINCRRLTLLFGNVEIIMEFKAFWVSLSFFNFM